MLSRRVSAALGVLVLLCSAACRGTGRTEAGGAAGAPAVTQSSAPPADADAASVIVAKASETLTGGAKAADTLPLVIVLGDDATAPAIGDVFRALPIPARFVVLAPSAGAESELGRDADELGRVATRLFASRASRGKPILLGAGRGGSVALACAARSPRALGAVIVVAAELPRSALPAGPAPEVGTPPLRVYIHHGSRDAITPVDRGGAASDDLALRGLSAVLHLDPRAGHELSPHLVAEMRARLAEEIRELP